MIKTMYTLSGLTCPACAKLAKRALEKLPDVSKISVDIDGKTEITASRNISSAEINDALKETDYKIL